MAYIGNINISSVVVIKPDLIRVACFVLDGAKVYHFEITFEVSTWKDEDFNTRLYAELQVAIEPLLETAKLVAGTRNI